MATRRDETRPTPASSLHDATRRRPSMFTQNERNHRSKLLSLFILGALCAPVEAVVYYGEKDAAGAPRRD